MPARSLVVNPAHAFVGAGLFAYYEPMRLAGSEPSIFSSDTNTVFPVWIVTELPVGLRGLILAGIFAAAISSLDSILAALSRTTLGLLKPVSGENAEKKRLMLSHSCSCRNFVIYYALNWTRSEKVNVVVLAFGTSLIPRDRCWECLASLLTPKPA